MRNGTALLVVLGLVALGALVFILLEALWPRKRVRRRRGAAGPPRTGPSSSSPPRPHGVGSLTPAIPGTVETPLVADAQRAERLRAAGPPSVERQGTGPQEAAAFRAKPHAGSWTSLEGVVQDLARQHEFAEARRRLAEALDDQDLPLELREVFSRLRADVAGAEVGQLTATALREAQRGSTQDVLSLLGQVEESLRAAGDALTDDRRDEATRRLWLTCTRLAAHRLGANDAAEALDWLFRSMPYAGGEPERLTVSSATTARALDVLVEQCAGGIQTAIAAGQHHAARAEAERCDALVRRAADAGVPEEMLDGVAAKVRELLENSSSAA